MPEWGIPARPARWQKAIIHLREKGQLEDSPKDIGKLIAEIQNDVLSDSIDYIKDRLWEWAAKDIKRGCVGGFPEWYKEELLKLQFEKETA